MTKDIKVFGFIILYLLLFTALFFLVSPGYTDDVDEEDRTDSSLVFLLPKEIIDSYFPQSGMYFIPEDRSYSSLIQRAQNYEKRNNFRRASKCYFLAYKKVQNTKKAPYIRFKQSTLLDKLDASIAGLKEILEKYPSFPFIDAVRFELAIRLYMKNDYESAVIFLKEIENHEKSESLIFTPYVYTFLGIISSALNNFTQAVEYYYSSLDILTVHGTPRKELLVMRNYLEISRAMIELKEYDHIADLLRRIMGSSSSELFKQEALLLLAQYYKDTGDETMAYSAYLKLIQGFPESIFILKAEDNLEELSVADTEAELLQISGIFDESLLSGTYKIGDEAESVTVSREMQEDSPERYTVGYFIQLGSFSEEKNAENLILILREQGFPAFSMKASVDNKTMFRVRVGSLATLQEAEEIMQSLISFGYQGYIVREK